MGRTKTGYALGVEQIHKWHRRSNKPKLRTVESYNQSPTIERILDGGVTRFYGTVPGYGGNFAKTFELAGIVR